MFRRSIFQPSAKRATIPKQRLLDLTSRWCHCEVNQDLAPFFNWGLERNDAASCKSRFVLDFKRRLGLFLSDIVFRQPAFKQKSMLAFSLSTALALDSLCSAQITPSTLLIKLNIRFHSPVNGAPHAFSLATNSII